MKDETYSYFSDVKTRGQISRSARNRRTHNGKRGRVKFPSDYMTKKEINAMNGEVKRYRMNSPIGWKEFKQWPDEHKVTYIKLLREKYNAPDSGIAKMMGVNVATFSEEMHRLGLNVGHRKTKKWDSEGFYAWVSGVPSVAIDEIEKEYEPEKAEEPVPVVEEETEEPIPEETTKVALGCCSLNYEAAYENAMLEMEKAKAEICYLREELRLKNEEANWLNGFKAAVEVIFGKGDLNG